MKAGLRSWKTSALGIIGGLVVLLNSAAAFIDDDPNTVLDMNIVTEAIVGIVMILWGIFSRDADKSSQDSGIRTYGRGVFIAAVLSSAVLFPSIGFAEEKCVQFGIEVSAPEAPSAAVEHESDSPTLGDKPETVSDGFRDGFLEAVKNARRKGNINLRQAIRLRIASLSPAFMEQAKTLAVTQIAFSGEESKYVPRNEIGEIEVNGIDWSGLLSFLEALLPILLQLLSGL